MRPEGSSGAWRRRLTDLGVVQLRQAVGNEAVVLEVPDHIVQGGHSHLKRTEHHGLLFIRLQTQLQSLSNLMRKGHASIVLNSQIFPLPVFCKQFYDVKVSSHFLALMPLKAVNYKFN